MKRMLEAWKWSLLLAARSPLALVGLSVLSALWMLAANQWLALPESSTLMLALAFFWGLVLVLIALSVLAGSAASAAEAAAFGGPPRLGLTFITFNRRLLGRAGLMALPAAVLLYAVSRVLAWVEDHTVEIASFLTFHSERPMSHIVIEKILSWLELAVWVFVCGFLLTFLIILLRTGWQEALRQAGRAFGNCLYRSSFLTSAAGLIVFGGLAHLLVNWLPRVPPGFWDYTQAVLRLGSALVLLVAGWLFTLLSLARLNPREGANPPS